MVWHLINEEIIAVLHSTAYNVIIMYVCNNNYIVHSTIAVEKENLTWTLKHSVVDN